METKTQKILKMLETAPMKNSEVIKMMGMDQTQRLLKAKAIEKYQDENPDYAAGHTGQKPFCLWVRLGTVEYESKGRYPEATDDGIAKAIKFLERNGYKVIPPND